jgi:RND family efflux transporter MFP subunit
MTSRIRCSASLIALLAACGEPKASLPEPTGGGVNKPQVAGLVASGGKTATSPAVAGAYLTGATEAHRRSALTARVAGVIAKVHVRDGDLVRAGQPLVSFDTEDFQLRAAQAEAGLRAAQVQYDATKIEWDRLKKLREDRAVPQSQLDMVNAKFEGTKAGVAQAEAMAGMARKALRDTTLIAPFAAVVTKRFVNEGEYATAMPPTTLVTLEETDPLDVRFQLPANEMVRVKAGDLVKLRFPATGYEVDATLTRVVASIDSRTRTFSAVVELPNPDRALWAGMFVDVRLAPAEGFAPQGGRSTTAQKAARDGGGQ